MFLIVSELKLNFYAIGNIMLHCDFIRSDSYLLGMSPMAGIRVDLSIRGGRINCNFQIAETALAEEFLNTHSVGGRIWALMLPSISGE